MTSTSTLERPEDDDKEKKKAEQFALRVKNDSKELNVSEEYYLLEFFRDGMKYFKLYETQRNHLEVGSKWVWKTKYEYDVINIIEIIDVRNDWLVLYRYTNKDFIYDRSKKDFLDHFKPYNETPQHELL